ncbi:MAG: hypothetical protein IPQ13_13755 [Holophagaceae bacterium]|nr:hypothetical protein [Holophagaceae bacterium]
MDLAFVDQVVETTVEDEVNDYLGKGWVLIAIAHGMSSAGDGDRPIILYSLGQLCPCPSQWKPLFKTAEGVEALAQEFGLSELNIRLLARGAFQPRDSVVQLCRQFCERHDLSSPL